MPCSRTSTAPCLDELADVDRRGDDAARCFRGDIGGFLSLEAAGRLERHGLLHGRDRRDVDRDRLGRLRRRLQPWFADRTRRQSARQGPQAYDEHRGGVQANLGPGGCERSVASAELAVWRQTLHDSNNVGHQSIAYQGYPRTAVTVRFDCGCTGRSVARGARVPVWRRRQEVREHEPIAFDDNAGHAGIGRENMGPAVTQV